MSKEDPEVLPDMNPLLHSQKLKSMRMIRALKDENEAQVVQQEEKCKFQNKLALTSEEAREKQRRNAALVVQNLQADVEKAGLTNFAIDEDIVAETTFDRKNVRELTEGSFRNPRRQETYLSNNIIDSRPSGLSRPMMVMKTGPKRMETVKPSNPLGASGPSYPHPSFPACRVPSETHPSGHEICCDPAFL